MPTRVHVGAAPPLPSPTFLHSYTSTFLHSYTSTGIYVRTARQQEVAELMGAGASAVVVETRESALRFTRLLDVNGLGVNGLGVNGLGVNERQGSLLSTLVHTPPGRTHHQPWAPCDPHAHQPWAPCDPHAHQPWAPCARHADQPWAPCAHCLARCLPRSWQVASYTYT